MSKPTTKPVWNTSGANRSTPSSGQQASGWTVNQAPPSSWLNWLAYWTYAWIDYLDEIGTDLAGLFSTANTWTAKQTFSGGLDGTSAVMSGRVVGVADGGYPGITGTANAISPGVVGNASSTRPGVYGFSNSGNSAAVSGQAAVDTAVAGYFSGNTTTSSGGVVTIDNTGSGYSLVANPGSGSATAKFVGNAVAACIYLEAGASGMGMSSTGRVSITTNDGANPAIDLSNTPGDSASLRVNRTIDWTSDTTTLNPGASSRRMTVHSVMAARVRGGVTSGSIWRESFPLNLYQTVSTTDGFIEVQLDSIVPSPFVQVSTLADVSQKKLYWKMEDVFTDGGRTVIRIGLYDSTTGDVATFVGLSNVDYFLAVWGGH